VGLKLLPTNFRMQQVRSFMEIDDRCYMFFGGWHSGVGRCGNGNCVGTKRPTARQSAEERAGAATELGQLAPQHCFWCGNSSILGYTGCWAFGRASAVSGMGRRWCDSCFYQLGQHPERFVASRWSERPFSFCGEEGCAGCCDPESAAAATGDTNATADDPTTAAAGDTNATADDPTTAAAGGSNATALRKPCGSAAHKPKRNFKGWGRNKKSVNDGRGRRRGRRKKQ
jgi:hypothetical protein